MDIPVTVTYKGEEATLPLLTTSELRPLYSKLKERLLAILKETLKEVDGINPVEKVEMLRRQKQQYYNIMLLVDYAATPEGVEEIWTLSLKKTGQTNEEVARICAWPLAFDLKVSKAIAILNPTEEGEVPTTKPVVTAPDPKDINKEKMPAVFLNMDDTLAAMAEERGPPSAPIPSGA